MTEWGPALIGAASAIVVALLGGGLAGLLLWRSNRNKLVADATKTEAEATDILTGAALDIVKVLRERVEKVEEESRELRAESAVKDKRIGLLEDRVETLEAEVECLQQQKHDLEIGNTILRDQVESAGLVPAWTGVP